VQCPSFYEPDVRQDFAQSQEAAKLPQHNRDENVDDYLFAGSLLISALFEVLGPECNIPLHWESSASVR